MKEVTFLEKLAENLLEGGFARALKPKLQPVQIAKALAKEMERAEVVGPESRLAANQYVVYLHPEDLADLAGFQAGLERELASYLKSYALRHHLALLAPPTVRLLPAPGAARRGRLRVESSLADAQPATTPGPTPPPFGWEGTAQMPLVLPERPPSPSQPRACLVDEEGQVFVLVQGETSIGRAVDNQIVLDARDASRHHARIVWDSCAYLLVDLDSTNGSFVSGQRVTRQPLQGGEQLCFGAARFTFRLRQQEES